SVAALELRTLSPAPGACQHARPAAAARRSAVRLRTSGSRHWLSALPSCLTEAFQRMLIVFDPHPRDALTHMHVDRLGSDSDQFCQGLLRLIRTTGLPQRRGKPATGEWVIGVRTQCGSCRCNGSLILTQEIVSDGNVGQSVDLERIVGVKP